MSEDVGGQLPEWRTMNRRGMSMKDGSRDCHICVFRIHNMLRCRMLHMNTSVHDQMCTRSNQSLRSCSIDWSHPWVRIDEDKKRIAGAQTSTSTQMSCRRQPRQTSPLRQLEKELLPEASRHQRLVLPFCPHGASVRENKAAERSTGFDPFWFGGITLDTARTKLCFWKDSLSLSDV